MLKGILLALPLVLVGPPPKAQTPIHDDPEYTRMELNGITVHVGKLKYSVGLGGGLTATGPVRAYGGSGVVEVSTGLVDRRTVRATIIDVDVAQIVTVLGDTVPAWLKPKLIGKVGQLAIDVAGNDLIFKASKFVVPGDPVQRIEMTADLKTRDFKAKIYAGGGVAELEGKLPDGK